MNIRTWEQLDGTRSAEIMKEFKDIGVDVRIEANSWGGLSEIVLQRKGKQIRITGGPTVHKLKRPTQKKYKVKGSIAGVNFEQVFEDKETAEARQKEVFDAQKVGDNLAQVIEFDEEIKIDECFV